MQKARFCLVAICCAWLVATVCTTAFAAKIVKGTLLAWSRNTVVIQNDSNNKPLTLKPESGATIMRGQLGKSLNKAQLFDLAPGDRIIAVLKQNGSVSSIKSYYSVARGQFLKSVGPKIFFHDGSSVRMRSGVQVVLGGGKIGKTSDLKAGSLVLCRLNPTTKEAWTVVATETSAVASKPANVPPVMPLIKPEVMSITCAGPEPLKIRDWVRVDLEGTPGCRATCQVKGLVPVTLMKEMTPGHYRAQVMIPSGKSVKDAALVGQLTFGAAQAEPVQAAKLITFDPVITKVAGMTAVFPEVNLEPTPEVSTPTPEPVAQTPAPEVIESAPVAPVTPELTKVKAPVMLTSPANKARIQRTLQVAGSADPGATVLVTITYNNSLGGILNLAGQVSSQLLAVGDDGQFIMGPIALEGPLATRGLVFTVSACYPESSDKPIIVSVLGDRS